MKFFAQIGGFLRLLAGPAKRRDDLAAGNRASKILGRGPKGLAPTGPGMAGIKRGARSSARDHRMETAVENNRQSRFRAAEFARR